jgi:hypothetical protein
LAFPRWASAAQEGRSEVHLEVQEDDHCHSSAGEGRQESREDHLWDLDHRPAAVGGCRSAGGQMWNMGAA